MTIIETAKMNGIDTQAYLADVLDRIHDHKTNRLGELLLWSWSSVAAWAPGPPNGNRDLCVQHRLRRQVAR